MPEYIDTDSHRYFPLKDEILTEIVEKEPLGKKKAGEKHCLEIKIKC